MRPRVFPAEDLNDGRLVLNPALVKYLERKGMFEAEEDAAVVTSPAP